MQCTTKTVAAVSSWESLLAQLPADLEERAQRSGALVRRRGIRCATDLLQLALAYGVGDYSLRQVGLWGSLSGVAEVSDVTILNRLRQSVAWLEELVVEVLKHRFVAAQPRAVRLRILDATTLSHPGSHSSDWRIHLSYDLTTGEVDALTLTDSKGGEGLHHFAFAPGEIVLADRAYGYQKQIVPLVRAGASCVVRVRWTNLGGFTWQEQAFDLLAWLRSNFTTSTPQTQEVRLQLSTAQGNLPLRLVVCQLPPEAAAQARRRMQRKRQKKGEKPSAESLYMAGFVLLLTNLAEAEWSPAQISDLYRVRWQVELYFKRLKSLLHLDHLRARDPQLARAYLLAKLLAALLLDRLTRAFLAPVPSWRNDLLRPVSTWRLTACLWLSLQWLFAQHWLRLWHIDPQPLRRYLCNSPRKRLQQDVSVRLFVQSLSVVTVLPSLS